MPTSIRKIEINFPSEVELNEGVIQTLQGLVEVVCAKYEMENPGKRMWLAEQGGKPEFNKDGVIVGVDSSIYCMGVLEKVKVEELLDDEEDEG